MNFINILILHNQFRCEPMNMFSVFVLPFRCLRVCDKMFSGQSGLHLLPNGRRHPSFNAPPPLFFFFFAWWETWYLIPSQRQRSYQSTIIFILKKKKRRVNVITHVTFPFLPQLGILVHKISYAFTLSPWHRSTERSLDFKFNTLSVKETERKRQVKGGREGERGRRKREREGERGRERGRGGEKEREK